jgi:hypothetical protein
MKILIYLKFYLYFLIEFTCLIVFINCSYFEKNLIESLLRSYDKKIRPLGTIQVKFALNLNQLITLIEKDQIIVINAFIDHEWFVIFYLFILIYLI